MAQAKPVTFREFAGINNLGDDFRITTRELRRASNVDIDDARTVKRRAGFGSPLAAAASAAHSLYYPPNGNPDVCLFRMGTTLYRLLPDYSVLALKTGLETGLKMAYEAAGTRIFMSDGIWKGWTDGETVRDWGITPPAVQPHAAVGSGGKVPKGKYLYALTYLRADGEESGTIASGRVELTSVGGIDFSAIPVSAQADVTMKCIYLTKPNGKDLYRAVLLANSATIAGYYGKTTDLRSKLTTQMMREPPPGRVLAFHNGRMLVADGRFVWYNPRPYELERFSALAVRPQTSNVNAIAVMDDGVFIGTENLIDFHGGADFADASVASKAKYGACFGGVAYLEGSRVPGGAAGRAAYMVTKRGLAVCGSQGAFQNVTETRYRYTAPRSVAAVARVMDSYAQLVAVMR